MSLYISPRRYVTDGCVAITIAVSLFMFPSKRPNYWCFRKKGIPWILVFYSLALLEYVKAIKWNTGSLRYPSVFRRPLNTVFLGNMQLHGLTHEASCAPYL